MRLGGSAWVSPVTITRSLRCVIAKAAADYMKVALLSPNGTAKKLSLARLAIAALVVIARRALLVPRLGWAPLGTFDMSSLGCRAQPTATREGLAANWLAGWLFMSELLDGVAFAWYGRLLLKCQRDSSRLTTHCHNICSPITLIRRIDRYDAFAQAV